MSSRSFVTTCVSLLALSGCIEADTSPPAGRRHDDSAARPEAVALPSRPRFVPASPSGEVEPHVAKAVAEARAEHRKLLVYVGAQWCEPCKSFHRAVESGELDEELRGVEFLEFDADRDRERLVAAGYGGRLVPRFAVPSDDGSFSGRKVEGGTKGDGAVQGLMRRLLPLLQAAG